MLLRSSSTPLLGSLLPPLISESPNHQHHHQSELHGHAPTHKPISCTNGNGAGRRSLFHSPSLAKTNGFRRVQSDGNLEGLADADELSFSNKLGRSRRNSISCCTMRPIPSFEYDGDDDDDDDSDEEDEDGEKLLDSFKAAVKMQEHVKNSDFVRLGGDEGEGKMYLATGLGGGGGGGGSYRPVAFDRGGGMEEHYKKMLEQNPGNSLLLRNYAHFLYKVKGDGRAAEEYYSRAILADEGGEDGEILAQYAKLIWELHRDKDRAANYFQRAVEVSSNNSHIQAAYASFLWDTEDEELEGQENAPQTLQVGQPLFHHGFMASATTA